MPMALLVSVLQHETHDTIFFLSISMPITVIARNIHTVYVILEDFDFGLQQ